MPTLHTHATDDATAPAHRFFLERRRSERRPVSGRATALILGQDRGSVRGRICSMQLLDLSQSGLAAIATEAIAAGTQISVFVPGHGAEKGFDLHGSVVRCTATDHGQHVAIRLQERLAA